MRLAVTMIALAMIALLMLGAQPPEQEEMREAFGEVLSAMAYAASGVCVFSIVWAGFTLMADGSDERGLARTRTAVVTGIVGLVLALSAKAVSVALLSGIVPIP